MSSKINCFYDIPDSSQHAIEHVNMKVMYSVVDSTMYNCDDVRKCSHYDNNTTITNKNTNNISTTPQHPKVGGGGGVEVANYVATDDHISLFKTTPKRKNVGVWVIKTVFDFTTATTGTKSCENLLDWNNNNTTIYTTTKCFKAGVWVKTMIDFVATKDCLSLFQCRNNRSTNKIDHLDNSDNAISKFIFADINTFPTLQPAKCINLEI